MFYESKQPASKSLGCYCPCDPNQVTEPSGWTHVIYVVNLARTEPAVDGHRRRIKCNHHSWFLKTAIKKEAIKYGFTPPTLHAPRVPAGRIQKGWPGELESEFRSRVGLTEGVPGRHHPAEATVLRLQPAPALLRHTLQEVEREHSIW